jgi:hypothetical protein
MTLSEQAEADHLAMEAAQTALNDATAKAAASASALLNVQPHLSLLAEIEDHAAKLEGEAVAGITAAVARIRVLLNV